jgi:hypothetical protein
VSWLLSDAALSGFNPIDITITTSTSGTGNGTFNVTFGAYNGDGTETLRSVITATEQNPAFGNLAASGSIVISQSPPTTTTTTTTTAPLLSWSAERDDGGDTAFVGPYGQTYNEGDSVLVNDGSGICWLLGTPSTTSPTLTITSLCNTTTTTTTTTTTAAPTCNAVDISNETYGTLSAACSGSTTANRDRTDGDPSNPQVGDIVYEDAGCSILKPAGIYKNITASAAIEIGSGGLITDVQFC